MGDDNIKGTLRQLVEEIRKLIEVSGQTGRFQGEVDRAREDHSFVKHRNHVAMGGEDKVKTSDCISILTRDTSINQVGHELDEQISAVDVSDESSKAVLCSNAMRVIRI
jgi:hypothetical protein